MHLKIASLWSGSAGSKYRKPTNAQSGCWKIYTVRLISQNDMTLQMLFFLTEVVQAFSRLSREAVSLIEIGTKDYRKRREEKYHTMRRVNIQSWC